MFKVLQKDFTPAEFKRVEYRVEVDASVSAEDLLAPECWAHVAKDKGAKLGAIIEVIPRNGEWYLRLMVRGKTETGLRVAILQYTEFKTASAPASTESEFEIKFRGRAGWSAVRKSDKSVVFEGGTAREDAEKYVTEQETALA